jgi:hypothetical protein
MTPEEVVEREKDEAAARAASPAKGAKGGAGEDKCNQHCAALGIIYVPQIWAGSRT